MKTVSEHNSGIDLEISNKTGILCDDCLMELYLTDPAVILATYPSLVRSICPGCDKCFYLKWPLK